MDHQDHVYLLSKGIPDTGGIWADFGSGNGAFTLALAELIGPEGLIYSIDKNQGSLVQQQRILERLYPDTTVHYLRADFSRPLDIPPLDGLVTANALHFHKQKDQTISLLQGYLKPGGRFLVVEYDADKGNHWVPYPFSYRTWQRLARQNGLQRTELLATVPSSFLGKFYAALSYAPAVGGGT